MGIGINLNYGPGELVYPEATSLLIEEGKPFDPGLLLESLLEEVERRAAAGPAAWAREYTDGLAWLGETVSVRPPFTVHGEAQSRESGLSGVMRGVDDSGFLLLAAEGQVLRIVAGDLHAEGMSA